MPEKTNVCTLFDDSCDRFSSRIAISDHGNAYDYARLRREVDRISSALLRAGCRPRTRVCLAVSHGFALVASVFAVLKAGAVYVPLDTRHPVDRLRFIAEDSEASMVLYSSDIEKLVAELDLVKVCLSDVSPQGTVTAGSTVTQSDLAYILYTSGSTGRPKGVGITHANLLNYVSWAAERYFTSPDDRIALFTTLAFDFTVTSIFPPLVAGASIGIHDGIADPMIIKSIIADRSINVIKITPAYLYLLAQLIEGHSHIRRLIVGGEALTVDLASRVRRQLPNVEIINEYGPTEATVGCLAHTFDPETEHATSVAIGKPIPGVQAYVLDDNGTPVADDEDREGELYLSGTSVAGGYLSPATDAAQEAFLDKPFQPGSTMYRTGDVVKRDRHGNLVFLGRRDDQVKIRGNRVELAEVSATVLSHPLVASTFVTAVREHGSATLVAIATGDDQLTEDLLIDHLESRLPAYMVPTSLKIVARLPLSPNQKVDRSAVLAILGKQGADK